MQIDNIFTAIWHDTTTWPWTPLTGLSATITIREKPSNTIVVNNQAMTEVWSGEYDYVFTEMNAKKAYSYVMNPNNSLAFVETGFVDPRMANMDGAITDIRWGGGGFSINYQAINSHTTNKVNELKEEIAKIPKTDLSNIEKSLNENYSQIELAKGEIIDRINESENEICSDIVRKTKELKEDNVKTRNLVRQKTEKLNKKLDKDEKDEEESDEVKELLEDLLDKEEWKEVKDLLDNMEAEEIDKLLT